jgi:hypothetical protein
MSASCYEDGSGQKGSIFPAGIPYVNIHGVFMPQKNGLGIN